MVGVASGEREVVLSQWKKRREFCHGRRVERRWREESRGGGGAPAGKARAMAAENWASVVERESLRERRARGVGLGEEWGWRRFWRTRERTEGLGLEGLTHVGLGLGLGAVGVWRKVRERGLSWSEREGEVGSGGESEIGRAHV